MTPKEAEDWATSLNELRLLVLFECDDGKFRQVALTPEQFKKVSFTVSKVVEDSDEEFRDGFKETEMMLSDEWEMDADNFIGLQSFYDEPQ